MGKIIFCLLSILICHSIDSQTIEDLRRFYNYDPSADLNYRVIQTTDTLQAQILYIEFTGANQSLVTAYLIIPQNNLRRYPAVLFLHGNGGDKNEFLSNALGLASNSFASLLIDDLPALPPSQKMNYQNYTEPANDLIAHRQSVINIRRGIDLLEQHPKIDADRIAFVGIDFGAWTGSIVAGVEFRILTYILINCPSQPSEELSKSNEPQIVKIRNNITTEQLQLYQVTLKKIDPEYYLPYHRNSNILFQFTQCESNLDDNTNYEVYKSASEPKKSETYKSQNGELINLSEALQNRNKWLFNHL